MEIITDEQQELICPYLEIPCLGPVDLCPAWVGDEGEDEGEEDCLFHLCIMGVKDSIQEAARFLDGILDLEPGQATAIAGQLAQVLKDPNPETKKLILAMIGQAFRTRIANLSLEDAITLMGKASQSALHGLFNISDAVSGIFGKDGLFGEDQEEEDGGITEWIDSDLKEDE